MSVLSTDSGARARVAAQNALPLDEGGGMQWRAVFAGALVGFAVTLVLTTLGTAIGVSASDAADGVDRHIGAGALLWWMLTVVAAGLSGGWAIARTARRDASYDPVVYGVLAWVIGATLLLFLLALGANGVMAGLGNGFGATIANSDPRDFNTTSTTLSSRAVDASKLGTWGLLISQLLGIAATVFAARLGLQRRRRGDPRDAAVAHASDRPAMRGSE
jgi:hypothetical protein